MAGSSQTALFYSSDMFVEDMLHLFFEMPKNVLSSLKLIMVVGSLPWYPFFDGHVSGLFQLAEMV